MKMVFQGKSPSDYPPILMFFAPETARTAGGIPTPENSGADNFATRYLGKERVVLKPARNRQEVANQVNGKGAVAEEFDVIEVRQLRPMLMVVRLYINADKIVTRVIAETRIAGVSKIKDVSLINLKPFQKFDPSEFAFQLPADARPLVFKQVSPRQ